LRSLDRRYFDPSFVKERRSAFGTRLSAKAEQNQNMTRIAPGSPASAAVAVGWGGCTDPSGTDFTDENRRCCRDSRRSSTTASNGRGREGSKSRRGFRRKPTDSSVGEASASFIYASSWSAASAVAFSSQICSTHPNPRLKAAICSCLQHDAKASPTDESVGSHLNTSFASKLRSLAASVFVLRFLLQLSWLAAGSWQPVASV